MLIETKRMIIRDFEEDDAVDLQEILGDAETMEHCEPPYSSLQTSNFLSEFWGMMKKLSMISEGRQRSHTKDNHGN